MPAQVTNAPPSCIPAPPSLPQVVKSADVIFIAVKPQYVGDVLREVGPHLTDRHTIVSIAAGITLQSLKVRLGPGGLAGCVWMRAGRRAVWLEGSATREDRLLCCPLNFRRRRRRPSHHAAGGRGRQRAPRARHAQHAVPGRRDSGCHVSCGAAPGKRCLLQCHPFRAAPHTSLLFLLAGAWAARRTTATPTPCGGSSRRWARFIGWMRSCCRR